MQKVSTKFGTDPMHISRKLLQALNSYSWPGNLREMENVIKRYMVLGDEQAIINELCPRGNTGSLAASDEGADANSGLKLLVRNVKGGAESVAIKQSLEGHGWNRKAAAYDLQISYKALLYKIKQYNLVPPQKQRTQSMPPDPPTLRATYRA
jgi:DNA-binding NtrC family response regulator